ncbi:MAG TPA: VWA domain-containing protein [Burkholderiales bacterium]
MLTGFFFKLREHRVPVSIKEFLALLEGLEKHVCGHSIDDFYYLSRSCLVKDEANYDRFDRAFGEHFKGIEALPGLEALIPEEWLRRMIQRHLTEEERAKIEKLGWDRLMEEFEKRLKEQRGRHMGGSKWIGTGGTSPYGAHGYHPEGIRIGPESAGNRSAVKVWDKREFRNLDDSVDLGTRNIKVALRRLRRFAREGAAEVLDLDDTVRSTAKNAGYLDLKLVPERHNAVKVLLFLDVGGSMEDHVKVCQELFSAASAEFKHLEYFYFHNCVYETVWHDNRRRHAERISTLELMHKYPHDYKLVLVGDATMSPYELHAAGGSLEHMNDEPGAAWLTRLLEVYPRAIWLNPQPEQYWNAYESIAMVRQLMGERMFPLTLEGLERGMRVLGR